MGKGQAAAKVLLMGEHAVVYGEPAIATGLPRGAAAHAEFCDAPGSLFVANFDTRFVVGTEEPLAQAYTALLDALAIEQPVHVHLSLDVPVGVGLGSSAAMGIATARALGALTDRTLSPETLDRLGFVWEGVFHGTPSGIDHAAAVRGGLFAFQRQDGVADIRPIAAAGQVVLVIGVAGPAASTRDMVDGVRRRVEATAEARETVTGIGRLVREACLAIESGDWPTVGALMNRNQTALERLGVSTPALERACTLARNAGALGAKLTGAGGGGCMVALTTLANQDTVLSALNEVCEEVLCRQIP